MGKKTRVLLADDHRMIREGLKALFRLQPDIEVIGEAETGRAAVRLAAEWAPDVVVMDVNMPDLNGVEATQQIVAHGNGTKVVALSEHTDTRFTTEMFRAGASGYVVKEAAFDELVAAIRAVLAGKAYLSPRITGAVVKDQLRGGKRGSSVVAKLTDREREVLQLLAEGKATKQVAARLHVSVKTVETHRRNVMEKLDLHSVAELTKYALREGITTMDAGSGT